MKRIKAVRLRGNNEGKSSAVVILWMFAGISLCILGLLVTMLMIRSMERDPAVGTAGTDSTLGTPSQQEGETGTTGGTGESFPGEYETPEGTITALDDDFYVSNITDEIFERMEGRSYGEGAPVTRQELRYVHVLHIGTDALPHEGELIVHESIAQDVMEIFYELYELGYVIEKIALVDSFGGDDNASMIVNNTSAFNARKIEGTDVWSNHAYGLAIDINPLYNPYVGGEDEVLPATARGYTDRSQDFSMKIDENDDCYRIFTEHGFTWGGSWEGVKDYMHFEKVLTGEADGENEGEDSGETIE